MAKLEKCGTLEGYARLLELASELGRRACEVLADGHQAERQRMEVSGPGGGPIRVELQLALKKIYGKPLPGEVLADGHLADAEQARPGCVEAEVVSNQLPVLGGAGGEEVAGVAATTKC